MLHLVQYSTDAMVWYNTYGIIWHDPSSQTEHWLDRKEREGGQLGEYEMMLF